MSSRKLNSLHSKAVKTAVDLLKLKFGDEIEICIDSKFFISYNTDFGWQLLSIKNEMCDLPYPTAFYKPNAEVVFKDLADYDNAGTYISTAVDVLFKEANG